MIFTFFFDFFKPAGGGGGPGSDTTAIHVDTAAEISGIAAKAVPIAADLIVIEDSADSNNKKSVQVGNLPGGSAAPTKVFYVDGNRVDSYTENGSISTPYKTIQAAITAASAGTTITISPANYVENLALKSGVDLVATIQTTSFSRVTISGKLTCSLTGGSVQLSGLIVTNTTDHAVEFIGTNAQKLRAYNCEFVTNGAGAFHSLYAINTNASSEIYFDKVALHVEDSSAGATCLNTTSASKGTIGFNYVSSQIQDDIDNISMVIAGAVTFWHSMDVIDGQVTVSDTASCALTLLTLSTSTVSALVTNSSGITSLGNVIIISTASPIVTGAGAFGYASVVYGSTGNTFAGTLNGGGGGYVGALPAESSDNILFNNTVSGLSATRVKTAIDELAASPGGGATNVLIYRPAIGATSGNVYKTFDEVLAAQAASIQIGKIIIDDPAATYSLDINIASAVRDFNGWTIESAGNVAPVLIWADGCTFTNYFVELNGVRSVFNNTAVVPIQWNTARVYSLSLFGSVIQNDGTVAAIEVNNAGAIAVIQMSGDAQLNNGNYEVVEFTALLPAGVNNLDIKETALVNTDAVRGAANILVRLDNPKSTYNSQSNHAGSDTISYNYIISGISGTRPTSPFISQQYFDTTLGLPIWYDGVNWIDAAGNTV